MAIILLAWLGLCFGSFLNAMVWRMHQKKDWVRGRSECEHCKHQLSALDLIPVFSWLFLAGKCRYCKKPVSWQHPAVELLTGLVFVGSYIFWPGGLHSGGQWVLFVTWLATSVGLLALLVYDAHWMILPNKILYPTFFVAVAGELVYLVGFAPSKGHRFLMWILSIAVASGIFWLLYLVSNGKWIGFGDVRLGLVTGTVLTSPSRSFLMIFLASVLGTLFVTPAIAAHKKTLTAKLPFGPFLILATILVVWFGSDILNWYKGVMTF